MPVDAAGAPKHRALLWEEPELGGDVDQHQEAVPIIDGLAAVVRVVRRPDLKLCLDAVDALLVAPDDSSRTFSGGIPARTNPWSLRRVVLALLACFAVLCAVAIYGLGAGSPHSGTPVRAPSTQLSR